MDLLLFRELKSKHVGAIVRFFPPLETLDRLGRHLDDRASLKALLMVSMVLVFVALVLTFSRGRKMLSGLRTTYTSRESSKPRFLPCL